MSREILFKGKRIDNSEWVEGYLFDNGFSENKKMFVGGFVIEKYRGTAADDWDVTGIDFYEIDPETICQYTGLTDRNGKKIWEGDILSAHLDDEYPEDVTYVEIKWNGFSWCIRESTEDDVLTEYDCSTFEVYGNIFDNPELLEREVRNE